MPERKTIERARKDKREGKSPTTQAGEFVREEIHHVREGKHGARSTKQAIAIGLSKARRAGVKLKAPSRGSASRSTRRKAKKDLSKGRRENVPAGRLHIVRLHETAAIEKDGSYSSRILISSSILSGAFPVFGSRPIRPARYSVLPVKIASLNGACTVFPGRSMTLREA